MPDHDTEQRLAALERRVARQAQHIDFLEGEIDELLQVVRLQVVAYDLLDQMSVDHPEFANLLAGPRSGNNMVIQALLTPKKNPRLSGRKPWVRGRQAARKDILRSVTQVDASISARHPVEPS